MAERRRYEERWRALFREGVESGDLRTDLDVRRDDAASSSRRRTGRTRGSSPAATRTSSPTGSWRSSSTAFAATRRRRDADPHRQPVRLGVSTSTGSRRCGRRFPRDRDDAHHAAGRGDGDRAVGRRRRRDLRLRRRRHLQRGAERHRAATCPSGSFPGAARASFRARSASRAIPGRPRSGSSEGRTRRIGLGRVNGRRFGFNAGLGFDAELVRKVDELGRRPDGRRPGDVAFVKVASGALWATARPLRRAARDRGSGHARRSCSSRTARRTRMRARWRSTSFPAPRSTTGLAYVAPVTLRARDLPRLLTARRAWIGSQGRTNARGARPRPDRRPLRRAASAPGRRRGHGRRSSRSCTRPSATRSPSSSDLDCARDEPRAPGRRRPAPRHRRRRGRPRRRGRRPHPGRSPRAVSRPRPPADVRRALGRLPPAGPHRHLRDLLEPRGDAGGIGVRARGPRLDLPGVP